MPSNDFLPFATGGSANVESQGSYATDTLRTNGNQPGVAVSAINNKAVRQATVPASQLAQLASNITGLSAVDNANTNQFLALLQAAFQAFPAVITSVTSAGSGTWNATFYFMIASGNATSGATYSDGTTTFTVVNTISAGTLLTATGAAAPILSNSGTLTKSGGTGDATLTYYAYREPTSLEVEMLGAGGGGGGGGTDADSGNNGTSGGNSTFGTTFLVANGGHFGGYSSNSAADGIGGTANLASGATGIAVGGGGGNSGINTSVTTTQTCGGGGGSSAFGGAGAGQGPAVTSGPGIAASANSGSGGGGGSGPNGHSGVNSGGSGGGAGGYVRAKIAAPLLTYGYVVGAKGTGGTPGGTGSPGAGGNGADGFLLITARYQ